MEAFMGIAGQKLKAFKEREETIIQAAFSLFADHGIESVTIDMIAEKASIGKGTIYKHFSSKNDIFATLIIKNGNALLEQLQSIDLAAPVMVQLKSTMRVFWDFQIKDFRNYAVHRKCDQLLLMDGMAPEVLQRFEQQSEKENEFIRAMIQKAIDEQIFADKPVDYFVTTATGLFRGVFDSILLGEVEPSEELFQLMQKMILKGFM